MAVAKLVTTMTPQRALATRDFDVEMWLKPWIVELSRNSLTLWRIISWLFLVSQPKADPKCQDATCHMNVLSFQPVLVNHGPLARADWGTRAATVGWWHNKPHSTLREAIPNKKSQKVQNVHSFVTFLFGMVYVFWYCGEDSGCAYGIKSKPFEVFCILQ